jgi:hypothetical protein
MQAMRICWPRSSGWSGRIIARSPGSEIAEHVKIATRAHQTMIWSRVQQVNTLRSLLREYYRPAWPRVRDRLARFARNRRLGDALFLQAFAVLNQSPGARAFHDRQCARGGTHYQALRTLANPARRHPPRLPTNPHPYDEHLAWHTELDKLNSAA